MTDEDEDEAPAAGGASDRYLARLHIFHPKGDPSATARPVPPNEELRNVIQNELRKLKGL